MRGSNSSKGDFIEPQRAQANRSPSEGTQAVDGPSKKVSAMETYKIEDSPWTDTKTQTVNFTEYKARIQAMHEKGKEVDKLDKNRLGDLNKDDTEIEVIDKATEEEKDLLLFDDYLKKGLVNIKNLVLKNPLHRTEKENEFLILYLKHQYEVFHEIDKAAI